MGDNNIKTKNSMPSFTRGTLEHLKLALKDEKITPPAFHFLTDEDKKCLAFVDIDGTIYQINIERIEQIEKILDGLKDDSGNIIPVTEYVTETITPISEAVQDLQKNGATILITSDEGGNE